MKSSVQAGEFLDLAVRDAISRASSSLLNRQSSEGYWWADLSRGFYARVGLHTDGALASSRGWTESGTLRAGRK